MYALTRRLDVLAPVLIGCNYSGGGTAANERKETMPAIENVVDRSVLQRKRVRVHDVSKRFESFFDERLVGTRHAEDGGLGGAVRRSRDGDPGLH